MRGERVLENILPEAGDVGRLRLLNWLETRAIRMESVFTDPLRRLAGLLTTSADGARNVAQRLRLSRVQMERLVTIAGAEAAIAPGIGDTELRRALQRRGGGIVRDLALLNWAGELALEPHQPSERNGAWQALLESAARWQPLEFPLKGRDVLALGVDPGKRVGHLLVAVEAWWEDGDYRADREACLARLKAIAESTP
jgi:poly(A) polymerase